MLPSENRSERILSLVVHEIPALFLCASPVRCGFLTGVVLTTIEHDTHSDVKAYGDMPRV